jgi:hypothetical protein
MNIRQELSPNGRFSLDVFSPGETPYFLATFRCIDGSAGLGELNAWFGPYPAASPDELVIRWDLPDHVCGFYLGSYCYGLFRFGAGRRRARGSFRVQASFSVEEIAWFCAKDQLRNRVRASLQAHVPIS